MTGNTSSTDNKSSRKRKSKNIKKAFLKHFAQYITPALPLNAYASVSERHIFGIMSDCIHNANIQSVQNYVVQCPTFLEWRYYISAKEDFIAFGKLCNVTWFHSLESLKFMCVEILFPLMKACNVSAVHAIGVQSGFNEACIQAYGIPLLCIEDAVSPTTPPQCEENTQSNFRKFVKTQKGAVTEEENNVKKMVYVDLRSKLSVSTILPYVKNASVIIFAGPMCLFPSLYRINEMLLEQMQYHRCVYETFGVSADRVVFDGELSCTCLIVYYRPTLAFCLPSSSSSYVMQDSANSFRQHYIRHALSGSIPNYWKYVLPTIPLAEFFKRLQPLAKKCLFDQMLVDVFSNSHMECKYDPEITMQDINKQDREDELQLLKIMQERCDGIDSHCCRSP